MALFGSGGILSRIYHWIAQFFGGIFQEEVKALSAFFRLRDAFDAGKSDLETGITRVKEFKFDPKWDSRVIKAPDAIDHLKGLYDSLFSDFRDRIDTLRAPISDFIQAFKPVQESQADPGSGLGDAVLKIESIVNAVNDLAAATEEAVKFVEAFNEAVLNLEQLDAIFLQQGNSRRIDKNASPRIRVGKLHS